MEKKTLCIKTLKSDKEDQYFAANQMTTKTLGRPTFFFLILGGPTFGLANKGDNTNTSDNGMI